MLELYMKLQQNSLKSSSGQQLRNDVRVLELSPNAARNNQQNS